MRLLALVLIIISHTPKLQGESSANAADRVSPTAFIETRGASRTYKSEFVESNDTGFGYGYTLGFHAGTERNIGLLLRGDSQTVAFGLNDSDIGVLWQDTIIRLRFAWFYAGVVIGTVQLKATQGGDDAEVDAEAEAAQTEFDVVGSGYGYNAGLTIGMMRRATFHLDVTSVAISNAREIDKAEISFGNRMDIDVGISFQITKEAFDLIMGLTQRTFVLETTSAFNEAVTGTYLGFRLNSFL